MSIAIRGRDIPTSIREQQEFEEENKEESKKSETFSESSISKSSSNKLKMIEVKQEKVSFIDDDSLDNCAFNYDGSPLATRS